MNGPTKSFHVLMLMAMFLSWEAVYLGYPDAPLLGMSLWALMFIALAFSAPMIYQRAKIRLEVKAMASSGMTIYQILDEVSRKHYDK